MTMLTRSIRYTVLAALLLPVAVDARPVTLNLSFARSDLSTVYQCRIKPFVDAVNRAAADQIRVEVHFGRAHANGLKAVLDGTIDIASILTSDSPERFPDKPVLQLPGLFRNRSEGSLVFTRLVKAGALAGYNDVVVLGAIISDGEAIHSRKPTKTLADLRGQSIRVNNEIEAATLKKFGANPVLLPINQTMAGLGQGVIDGATLPLDNLFEFGIGRLTANHYLLGLGAIPGILVMNRTKFESLSASAQEIIRQHSGIWLAERAASCLEAKAREVSALLTADARRKVVTPSKADQAAADKVFATVTEEWAAQSPRHRELLGLVKAEIAEVRARK